MKKRNIILFDIDYTLFNAKIYRELMFAVIADTIALENRERLLQALEEVYFSHRKKTGGYFDIEFMLDELARELAIEIDTVKVLEAILADEASFQRSLFDETVEVMEKLGGNKELHIGVFSSGREAHQLRKLQAFAHVFKQEHMHIFLFKNNEIASVMKKYKNDNVYLVDDVLEILYKAKQFHPHLVAIWMKRGRLADKQKPIENFTPDYTVEDLREIEPILFIK